MLISITGKLGSGKSTICNIMRDEHGYEVFCTGAIQREYARELGISTLELNKRLMTDPGLDHEIDSKTTRISIERSNDKLMFDSRMAWHFAVNTFKIFLTIDPMEAARRVMENQRGAEEKYTDINDACRGLVERSQVERERFIQIYGVDYHNENNYDLIVDTTDKTPHQVVDIILKYLDKYETDKDNYISPIKA